jgi:hypothetical protein
LTGSQAGRKILFRDPDSAREVPPWIQRSF